MLTTEQANEATENNTYPSVRFSQEECLHLVPIYKAEQHRINAEWRKWLAHTYLPSEVVGSDLETMVWVKVGNDAESSVRNSRRDIEENYKALSVLISVARGNHVS